MHQDHHPLSCMIADVCTWLCLPAPWPASAPPLHPSGGGQRRLGRLPTALPDEAVARTVGRWQNASFSCMSCQWHLSIGSSPTRPTPEPGEDGGESSTVAPGMNGEETFMCSGRKDRMVSVERNPSCVWSFGREFFMCLGQKNLLFEKINCALPARDLTATPALRAPGHPHGALCGVSGGHRR